jgi:hypothetical protein
MGKAPLINKNSKIEYPHRLSRVAGLSEPAIHGSADQEP